MIYDRLDHIDTYRGINGNLDKAIQAIKMNAYQGWGKGRHEIAGDDVFCNRIRLETTDEAQWERHERYLDIHIIVDGSEVIRCSEIGEISGWNEFDREGDYALAQYSAGRVDFLLEPGWFLIVFPQDAHMPGLKGNADYSEKAIFKVRIQ